LALGAVVELALPFGSMTNSVKTAASKDSRVAEICMITVLKKK
jgi:hypothetical protein